MTTYSATYSPEDNKLRLYASSRLDAETYARVKAAGFIWAPKQDLFVAPMWTPSRENLLIELCGEVGDEDTSLVDRAEQRADRFEDYSDKRAADAESARQAVAAIADGIPMGQPILVGHHSERHARKDAQRIENGMRRAVKMWETSTYWTSRAAGAIRHAKYKELPAVRARRIKGLQADQRKQEKQQKESSAFLGAWQKIQAMTDAETQRKSALFISNRMGYVSHSFPLDKYPRNPPASQYEGAMSIWSALEDGIINAAQAAELCIPTYARSVARCERWLVHIANRLAYECAMLDEAGASDLLNPKPKGPPLAPLLNYRAAAGHVIAENQYHRGETITYRQVEMTKAEYGKISTDYKCARLGLDRKHRFRTAMIQRCELVSVFLIDSKEHPEPAPKPQPDPEPTEPPTRREPIEETEAAPAPVDVEPYTPPPAPQLNPFEAMKQSLKAGVQVVTAPQLFPTPKELAGRVADLAAIEPGQRVLEPSAGTGMLLGAMGCRMFGHNPERGEVVAVELNQKLADRLRSEFPLTDVHCADFLQCNGALGMFDRVLMNPPFENGADIKHIEHAAGFLKPGGRLVAICANGPRQNARLRPMASHWEELPAGTFAGTGMHAALLVIEG